MKILNDHTLNPVLKAYNCALSIEIVVYDILQYIKLLSMTRRMLQKKKIPNFLLKRKKIMAKHVDTTEIVCGKNDTTV